MANRFFNAVKSAFIVTEDEVPSNKEKNVVQSKVVKSTVNENVNITTPSVEINEKTINSINQGLLDKLCERLEQENLPGPDYMELKTAMNDDFIVEAVPDENKRFGIAFKTLQASSPGLTKQYVLESIDKYIKILKDWETEALVDVNKKRNDIIDKKKEIETLTQQMNELLKRRDELQTEVNTTEEKCTKNENDMKSAVGFLVSKLEEDKNKINVVL